MCTPELYRCSQYLAFFRHIHSGINSAEPLDPQKDLFIWLAWQQMQHFSNRSDNFWVPFLPPLQYNMNLSWVTFLQHKSKPKTSQIKHPSLWMFYLGNTSIFQVFLCLVIASIRDFVVLLAATSLGKLTHWPVVVRRETKSGGTEWFFLLN